MSMAAHRDRRSHVDELCGAAQEWIVDDSDTLNPLLTRAKGTGIGRASEPPTGAEPPTLEAAFGLSGSRRVSIARRLSIDVAALMVESACCSDVASSETYIFSAAPRGAKRRYTTPANVAKKPGS